MLYAALKNGQFRAAFACSGLLILSLLASCRTMRNQEAATLEQTQVSGYATNFTDLGKPYGGCGVPQERLESPNFVALNVQHTPNDYKSHLARPIEDSSKIGEWDNGRNCGRWIRVSLAQHCRGGSNSGVPGTDYCAGGKMQDDESTGATLDFIVADSCQDGNRWCRDDRYHVDLATGSLPQFQKDGRRISTITAESWTNPTVTWKYIDAPNYKGDIKIGFVKNAELFWPAIMITHLPRGIHGVEFSAGSTWKAARPNGDNGQVFVLEGAKAPFRIRIRDASDELLAGGRIYEFGFPCKGPCPDPYNPVTYKTTDGSGQIDDPTEQKTPPKVDDDKSPDKNDSDEAANDKVSPPIAGGSGALKASLSTRSSWATGICVDIKVTNTGSSTVNGWGVTVDTNGGSISQVWNGSQSKSANNFRIEAGQWSKQLAPQASTDNVGFCIEGSNQLPQLVSVGSE